MMRSIFYAGISIFIAIAIACYGYEKYTDRKEETRQALYYQALGESMNSVRDFVSGGSWNIAEDNVIQRIHGADLKILGVTRSDSRVFAYTEAAPKKYYIVGFVINQLGVIDPKGFIYKTDADEIVRSGVLK